MSVWSPGFHAAVIGAPIGSRARARPPGPVYELDVRQLSDWIDDRGGRDEIRATCRRWLEAHPELADVVVRHADGRELERIRR